MQLLTTINTWPFDKISEGNPFIRLIKSLLRVIIITVQEALYAKIPIRASALTYTIILSMVPLLAMSTAVLKGMGHGDELRLAAERFVQQIDPGSPTPAEKHAESDDTQTDVPSTDAKATSLTDHLYRAIDTIFDYVDQTNFAALGAIGTISLLAVVIMVFSSIEGAMNAIWRTPEGRPIFRKIMDYMALLILLPVSINLALGGDAILASESLMSRIATYFPAMWLVKAVLKFLPFLFIVLTLMLMYLFFSRARVTTFAAFIGAVFAAVFWLITQKIYIVAQIGVANSNVIYGSFATVPLFLVWLHLGWLFILLGATLAYAVQNRNNYCPAQLQTSPQRLLQLTFDIANTACENFSGQSKTTLNTLARKFTGFTTFEIETALSILLEGNILRTSTDDKEELFFPSAPSENIRPSEILDLFFKKNTSNSPGAHLTAVAAQGAFNALKKENIFAGSHNKEE